MKWAFILVAVITTGCGQQPNAPVTVDPVLALYMVSFETDIGASSDGISANFANTEEQSNSLGETVGECVSWSNGDRQIKIDSIYWGQINENQKIELMYHELGHCALNMQHIIGTESNGCPISIMYPFTFGSSSCFIGNEQYYFQELASHR